MLLNAVCPHCQDAELQIPAEERGTDVICRRCGKKFLFQPTNKSVFDTFPPIAPEPTRPKAPKKTQVSEPVALPHESTDFPDYAQTIATVSICLFGPAMIATQFSYGRIVAVILLCLGILLAAIGLLGIESKRWTGWLGLGANTIGLILATLLPGWLGASTWLPPKPETSEFKVPTAVPREGPARPVSWVEAGEAAWEMGDTRVAVAAISVEPPTKPKAGIATSSEADKTPTLRITIQLSNVGLARTIEFRGWFLPPPPVPPPAGNSPVILVPQLTADGKPISPKVNPPIPVHPVHPGKSVETVLFFSVPSQRDELRLELPPEAIGGTEPIRFHIPWSLISRRQLVPNNPANP